MRILGFDQNKTTIKDHLSGDKLTIFYRTPDTRTRVAYRNDRVKRVKGQAIDQSHAVRQKYGLEILTGIGEGCFGVVRDGKAVPISSDPDSSSYDPKWKEIVAEQAGDVIEILALQVFEFSVNVDDAPENAATPDEGEDAEGN